MKNYRKLRYGGVAVALTALIIAAIVLFNVIFTALAQKYMWYIDMTQNAIYSLTTRSTQSASRKTRKTASRQATQIIRRPQRSIYISAQTPIC